WKRRQRVYPNGTGPSHETSLRPRRRARGRRAVRPNSHHRRAQHRHPTYRFPFHHADVRHPPEISGRMERGDYFIQKVALETMPGYYLGGNLYRPLHPQGKIPAVLTPHGHWTYGRLENSEGYSGPALGINLARQGYVAFAYDMVGYNDTLQTEHRFSSPTYQLWSFTPLGLQLWNSIRALDFVESSSTI